MRSRDQSIPIQIRPQQTRLATPQWLTDTDVPAPCPCGRDLTLGEPFVVIETEADLKRMMHIPCALQAGLIRHPGQPS